MECSVAYHLTNAPLRTIRKTVKILAIYGTNSVYSAVILTTMKFRIARLAHIPQLG